ncbi:MAG: hypothetical protein GY820_34395 [Gammaproteobacteria bacterium]|nr:hypothetical protein [Gammaproteobacteria bacterium]
MLRFGTLGFNSLFVTVLSFPILDYLFSLGLQPWGDCQGDGMNCAAGRENGGVGVPTEGDPIVEKCEAAVGEGGGCDGEGGVSHTEEGGVSHTEATSKSYRGKRIVRARRRLQTALV